MRIKNAIKELFYRLFERYIERMRRYTRMTIIVVVGGIK